MSGDKATLGLLFEKIEPGIPLNKNITIEIEDYNGHTAFGIRIENGEIKEIHNLEWVDTNEDAVFDTDNECIRLRSTWDAYGR